MDGAVVSWTRVSVRCVDVLEDLRRQLGVGGFWYCSYESYHPMDKHPDHQDFGEADTMSILGDSDDYLTNRLMAYVSGLIAGDDNDGR